MIRTHTALARQKQIDSAKLAMPFHGEALVFDLRSAFDEKIFLLLSK